jgi:transketolase
MMANRNGPCYMRTIRSDLPILYSPSEQFEIGGAKVLKEGKDVAIMASGYMVHTCLEAVDALEKEGIYATLIDCYSMPMKPEIVSRASAENKGRILTVEDNYGGGIGDEIASIVAADPALNATVRQMTVNKMPKSGKSAEDVLEYVGLGLEDIIREVKAITAV